MRKKIFYEKKFSCILFQFLGIKTLDPEPDPYQYLDSLEMLDPDPYPGPDAINPDPQHWFYHLLKKFVYRNYKYFKWQF
jgi:hypothetical protein